MDRAEWSRRNRAAAAEQAKTERGPSLLRVGRAALDPVRVKRGPGAPENKNLGGPPQDKDDSDTNLAGIDFASPAAEQLAYDLEVRRSELLKVEGTGKDGRYTTADVRNAAGVTTENPAE